MMTSHLSHSEHDLPHLPTSSQSFRPAKRRRFYRKRTETDDEDASDAPPTLAAVTPELQTVDELISHNGLGKNVFPHPDDETAPSIADLVRQRKAIQRRRGGIEFTNLNPSLAASNGLSLEEALVVREDDTPADIKSVIERFAPQTGQITETTDKHMYALPSQSPQSTRCSN